MGQNVSNTGKMKAPKLSTTTGSGLDTIGEGNARSPTCTMPLGVKTHVWALCAWKKHVALEATILGLMPMLWDRAQRLSTHSPMSTRCGHNQMECRNPQPIGMDETTANRPHDNPHSHRRDTSVAGGYNHRGRHTGLQPTITAGMGCRPRRLAGNGMAHTTRIILDAMAMQEVHPLLDSGAHQEIMEHIVGYVGPLQQRAPPVH